MASGIAWYSTNRDLSTEDRGAVDVEAAMDIVRRYFGNLKTHYDSGEEALAATMFGFSRSESDYIELCIHTTTHVALRVEPPPRSSGGVFRRLLRAKAGDIKLGSQGETEQCVREYFQETPESFRLRLAAAHRL